MMKHLFKTTTLALVAAGMMTVGASSSFAKCSCDKSCAKKCATKKSESCGCKECDKHKNADGTQGCSHHDAEDDGAKHED